MKKSRGAKTAKKRANKPRVLVHLAIAAVMVYIAVSLITTQMQIVSRKNELEQVQNAITATQQENEEMKRVLESDQESEFIERIARKSWATPHRVREFFPTRPAPINSEPGGRRNSRLPPFVFRPRGAAGRIG